MNAPDSEEDGGKLQNLSNSDNELLHAEHEEQTLLESELDSTKQVPKHS